MVTRECFLFVDICQFKIKTRQPPCRLLLFLIREINGTIHPPTVSETGRYITDMSYCRMVNDYATHFAKIIVLY